MNLTKLVTTVVVLSIASVGLANAQSLRDNKGPAELPPPGFEGRQFVDSAGCIYVRAGVRGATIWVPRVTRQRQIICGQTPSISRAANPQAALRQPTSRRIATTRRQPQPVRQATVQSSRPATSTIVGATQVVGTYRRRVPAGYQRAWDDDRLNSRRAQGTAEGQARMEQLWTSTVPRELEPNVRYRVVPAQTVYVSTRSSPGPDTTAARRFVQVGSYQDPINARSAAQRLQAAGLPARISATQRNGQRVEVVLAGPFTDISELRYALRISRSAGFGDAFVRQ